MYTIRKLGSIYLDEKPVKPGWVYGRSTAAISLGDTVYEKAITWISTCGLLIANQSLLKKVSWNDLERNGLVWGKEIVIDRLRYRVRLMKQLPDEQGNEWDNALEDAGGNNDMWHWRDNPFWEQDGPCEETALRITRGGHLAHSLRCCRPNSRQDNVGYRPVLEPITVPMGDDLIGEDLLVWTDSGGMVTGRLVEHTSYDLVFADGAFFSYDGRSPSGGVSSMMGVTCVDLEHILTVQTFVKEP